MIRMSIQKEDTNILNLYVSNAKAHGYLKQL